ncbi:MAG: DUF1905 domain-containing protein [Flavobacteriales bacterium]|nr:DUF1905 domain-containing protein [Flavobacteriales bacterium]
MKDRFETVLEKLDSKVWSVGIKVPSEVSKKYIGQEYKRVLCTLNDIHTYQAPLLSMGESNYYINVNQQIQKKLKIGIGDSIMAEIEPDNSKYGLPMPEELSELLKMDNKGSEVFHKLTPGVQRNLIHIVGTPKSSEIRIRKAIAIVEYIKQVDGKIVFKELNIALKNG